MQKRQEDPKYHTDETKIKKEAMQQRQQDLKYHTGEVMQKKEAMKQKEYDKALIKNKQCIKVNGKYRNIHINGT